MLSALNTSALQQELHAPNIGTCSFQNMFSSTMYDEVLLEVFIPGILAIYLKSPEMPPTGRAASFSADGPKEFHSKR